MAGGIVFDDGVRFYDAIRVRMPSSLREQVKAAADREGLNPAEFARRALAERALRTAGSLVSGAHGRAR
jgi:hypothetical protein